MNWRTYHKTGQVEASELDIVTHVETDTGWQTGQPGDFLARDPKDPEGSCWIIPRAFMLANYEEVR